MSHSVGVMFIHVPLRKQLRCPTHLGCELHACIRVVYELSERVYRLFLLGM